MGWFDGAEDQSNQYKNEPSKVHELIGGAAAYEAAKAYEGHQAANGKPASHAEAKEVLAGLAGAFIDREAETKGADFFDKVQAKRDAKQHIDQNFSEQDYNSY